jgi:hypothetical protein
MGQSYTEGSLVATNLPPLNDTLSIYTFQRHINLTLDDTMIEAKGTIDEPRIHHK